MRREQSVFGGLIKLLCGLGRCSRGNITTVFALSIVPIVGGVGAAVDYSNANSIKSALHAATDSAALATIKSASTLSSAQVQSMAQGFFNASFNRPNISASVIASYDSGTSTVTVAASANYTTSFMKTVGFSQMNVSATSKATLGGGQTWPVCVLITDPDSNHTELVKSTSTIDFYNCMNQVNTANWDAVEARDTSYIHTTNGVNCFTGDIHYGDVSPAKQPTCTMLQDPFASYTMPASASTCTYTQMKVQTENTVLTPGTYCKGLQIQNIANVTFSPGVYIISGGNLNLQGQGNSNMTVTANNVTFILTGGNVQMKLQNVTFNSSPYMGSDAGQFAGFLFFLDQTPGSNGKVQYQGNSQWNGVTMNSSGIVYLAGLDITLQNNSNITLNTGTFVAGSIQADSSAFKLYGTVNSPSAAAAAMKKTLSTNTPVLVY